MMKKCQSDIIEEYSVKYKLDNNQRLIAMTLVGLRDMERKMNLTGKSVLKMSIKQIVRYVKKEMSASSGLIYYGRKTI